MQEKAIIASDQQFLTFLLADEQFAVDILHVKEIIGFSGLTHIPMVPDYIRGILNLRGNVVPVIDLGVRFGHKVCEVTKLTCIVIVEVTRDNGSNIDLGIMVDAVNEVISINAGDIEPAPRFGSRVKTDFIEGMGKIRDQFIILLNISRVLDFEDFAMLEGIQDKQAKLTQGREGMNIHADRVILEKDNG